MNQTLRRLGRLLPRSVRNYAKAPGRSLRWWWRSRLPDVMFSPGFDWAFRCPQTAVEGAFHLQLDDPPQVAEFAEFMALTSSLKDPLFFDIGCHFGLFSFAVVDRCGPGARAVAVDPSGTACAMVRKISMHNGWDTRLTVHQAAAGDCSGELEMVDAGVLSAGYFVLPGDQPPGDRVKVRQLTIDELVRETGRRPDLIKVDVESFEHEVILGGGGTLAGAAIPLCLELHNQFLRNRGVEPEQVLQNLEALGYRHFTCAQRPISPAEIVRPEIIRVVATRDARIIS